MGQLATPRSAGVVGSTEPDYRGLCADHWESRAISVWEADCELSRTGAAGKVQRKSETAGSHHQTREFDGALFAGGGGTGHSAQSSRVAQEVRPAHDATRAQDRQGSDGAETGRCSLLDVAQGMELRAVKKFGSQGRKSGSHAGVPTASTWYPRLRSSRIIRFVRLRLDFAFTAGPRSS